MKILRGRLDDDLERTLECLDSECDVNVRVWVRSLLRAGLAELLGRAAPGVAHLQETPPAKAPPLRRRSPYLLEGTYSGSCWMGDTHKLPENHLVGRAIEITTRGERPGSRPWSRSSNAGPISSWSATPGGLPMLHDLSVGR